MASSLKIIFAGTPDFAAASLQALLETPHEVVAVYTQPDRPSGRGRKLTASPVKQLALQHNLPVYQPISLRDPVEQETLAALQADVMIVVAYGLILPLAVLQAPRLGCINVHGSLLPAWRGAAPIQRAVLAGDTITGITIMQMDVGLDTGPILSQTSCPILPTDTSDSLYHTLAHVGAEALVETLAQLTAGLITPKIQDEQLATHAAKMTKEEANIDWHQPAVVIERQVRGFNPWPIAYTQYAGQTVRVWKAECDATTKVENQPGTVLQISPQGIDVATGEGVLRLQSIQFAGGRAISIADYLNGSQSLFKPGTLMGSIL